jgi:two-component system chemotaxis sensor kinase CheA
VQSEDLDDYFSECDEHLTAARRILLELESSSDLSAVKRDQLDGLFRAFHSIKGLSGMVGARDTEAAAHSLESFLGFVRTGEASIENESLEVLLDGVDYLEAAIVAFRDGKDFADNTNLLGRLANALPSPTGKEKANRPTSSTDQETVAELTAEELEQIVAAASREEKVWRLTFSPSPELAAQGVNVSSIRERLTAAGQIIQAKPSSQAGVFRFHFLVTTPDTFDPVEWSAIGIEARPYLAPKPTAVLGKNTPTIGGLVPANLVRVELSRLDDLMRSVGDLVLSRSRLETGLARVSKFLPVRERRELAETVQIIERQLRDLRESVMRVRMVPVKDLFSRMRFIVRDLLRETGKEVELVTFGEETEIDKLVVERMADPMLHLVRNAIIHGIESVSERKAAGKPERGKITLSAATVGGMIVIQVDDDGRGINVPEVFSRAKHIGLIAPDAQAEAGNVLDLLCTPGFSTREQADLGSGRGVGMDVVRHAIEGLGGSLSLEFELGKGSRFIARLPLTLVIADVLTITVEGRTYALPQTTVREVVQVEAEQTTRLENNELIRYHGGVLPLLRLSEVLDHRSREGSFVALVTGEGSAAFALAADRAVGLREVVVRPMADPLIQVPGIGGATELGDGIPILILDPSGLSRLARLSHTPTKAAGGSL